MSRRHSWFALAGEFKTRQTRFRPNPAIPVVVQGGGTRFGNFENLTGGSLADSFTLAPGGAWDGTLNGGTGQEVLSAAPGQNIWTTLGTGTGTLNGKKFLGVEIRR